MTDLVLHITNEQLQQIEEIARERGYKAPDDYLLALVAADEKIVYWLTYAKVFTKP